MVGRGYEVGGGGKEGREGARGEKKRWGGGGRRE